MNTPAPEVPLAAHSTAAGEESPFRKAVWSVRRELWENRFVYAAPLAVTAFFLFGFTVSTIGLAHRRRAVLLQDAAHQRAAIGMPYDVAAMMLIFAAFIIGLYYCLEALHGERRDRSVLFWKSLPVSDRITVLSKAAIPLLVLPSITFVLVVVAQIVMLMLTSAELAAHGMTPSSTWAHLNFFQEWMILLYGLIVLALWHAPLYAWLLLVSAWARRATLLWAVLPVVAMGGVERLTFGSSHFLAMLKSRFVGFGSSAFRFGPQGSLHSLAQLTPGNFLTAPGLWFGLAFAAAFLAAAVRVRRYREPI